MDNDAPADALLRSGREFTAQCASGFGYVEARETSIRLLPDAIVTARRFESATRFEGAVYDAGGKLVPSSLGFREGEFAPIDADDLGGGRAEAARVVPSALYGGTLFPILGHFLFDTIARLWPRIDLDGRAGRAAPNLPVIFHPWLELDLSRFMRNRLYRDVLAAFGIAPRDIILADRDLRVERLYYPSTLSIYHVFLHPLMTRVIDHLVTELQAKRGLWPRRRGRSVSRVFLSRSRWPVHQRIRNEDELEALFVKLGFAIVHPQAVAPAALIDLLQGAEILAATDGSHAHLAAFCRAGTRTLLIDTRPVPTQFAIEKLRCLRAFHLPVFQNGLWNETDGRVDVSERMAGLLAAHLDEVAAAEPPPA